MGKFRNLRQKLKETLNVIRPVEIAGRPVVTKGRIEDSETEDIGTGSRTRPSIAPSNSASQGGGEEEFKSVEETTSQRVQPLSIRVTESPRGVTEDAHAFQLTRRTSRLLNGFSRLPNPTRDNSRISVTPTDATAYTTCCDNGEQSAAEYISQQIIRDVVPSEDEDGSIPYAKRLRSLLIKAEVQSDWQHTGSPTLFIPCTKLVAILNQTSTERLLQDVMVDSTKEERVHTAGQICGATPPPDRDSGEEAKSFRKVLATLIHVGKHESILEFMRYDPPISDQVLPLHMVYNSEGERCGLALKSSRNVPISFTTRWDMDKLQDFCGIQWRMYPTFFAVKGNKDENDHEKVHYRCSAGTILPFVHYPSPQSTWDHKGPIIVRRSPKSGGFGTVSFHRLHNDQQNLRRYTTEGPKREVAVKKLNNSSGPESFQNELKMLIKLTPLPTPHLAKLLATFEIEGKQTTDYCFMSETADSNLQEFWSQDPTKLAASLEISPIQFARWVAQQCAGLANAMREIHKYPYQPNSDPDGPRHGFHGDVKPDNILVYNGWVGHEHPLGILQITDFGISSFHHTASLSGISRGKDTHAYRPPESHVPFIMKTTQSHDIWTLGCLFLEFMIWFTKGPDALKDFHDLRRSGGFGENDTITTFHSVEDVDGMAVISIPEIVLVWAQQLCDDLATGFICDFVELITRQMLVIEDTGIKPTFSRTSSSVILAATATMKQEDPKPTLNTDLPDQLPTKRITAEELAKVLDGMVNQDDGYYLKPLERHEIPDLGEQYDGTRQVIAFYMNIAQLARVTKEQEKTLSQ